MSKVAIVGSQELTRDNAPYNDPEYEIWSFSDWLTAPWLKRCDALFEIHLANVYMNHPRTPEYWFALQQTTIPVYMNPVADPRVPNSVLYPLDSVLGLVSSGKNLNKSFKPLNSSVAFAMGLAILKEYDVIDVYGVELENPGEQFAKQSNLFAFWVGVAVSRGIEVNVNCSNGLFHKPLYGSEDTTPTAMYTELLTNLNNDIAIYKSYLDMATGGKNLIENILNGSVKDV